MTSYDPNTHRTLVAENGGSSRKFHSVNKLLIDMEAAGMIGLHVGDDPPSDTSVVWLDLTLPENGNGQAKVYDGGSWVTLTPEYFALHYGASTQTAEDAATAAAASASAAASSALTAQSNAALTDADRIAAEAAQAAAEAAQAAAEQAKAEAEVAADNFDDVYLGSKSTDPVADNDGNPLVEGQLHWSIPAKALKVYDGTSWQLYTAASGLLALVEDASPQLGGDLDLNGHVVTGLEVGINVQAYSANLDTWSSEVPANFQPASVTLTSLAGASANGVSLVTAADYAAMRGLLDLEAGTDFYSKAAADAAFQPIDSDLTAIAALTTTAAGRSVLTIADPSADRILAWDSSLGGISPIALADITAEAAPAAGDHLLLYGAEGDLRKVDWGDLPSGGTGGGREVLTANRTYYVRSDGSDSNDGLADSAGGAFLTLQKAVDAAASLDLGIYDVTIQCSGTTPRTFTSKITLKSTVGAGQVIIIGDETTPTNFILSTTGEDCFRADQINGNYSIRGFKLTTTTSGACVHGIGRRAFISHKSNEFGAAADTHLFAEDGGVIDAIGSYKISGGAAFGHALATTQSLVRAGIANNQAPITVTITGVMSFTNGFALSTRQAFVYYRSGSCTINISGATVTGLRYAAQENSVINTTGGGANYFPGNSAGSVATGGQYT